MSNRLLFIDTETGGIDPDKHSLLSVGVVVWDQDLGELFSDEFFVYAESYVVTKSAARINHFDEEAHNSCAIDATAVIDGFYSIKERFFSDYSSLPLAGHNTLFDIQFIKRMFLNCGRSYEKLFSHRVVDTYAIMKFLADAKCIPSTVNSSASGFKHFGITVQGRHTALGDARATMELYMKLLHLLKRNV